MEKNPHERRLVVSFHDLHPGSMECCVHFLDRLALLGVPRASLLVVPYWYGREPLSDHPEFCAWLRELPHDISLHGWTHKAGHKSDALMDRLVATRYTAGEGEFYRLPATEADYLLGKGLEMFFSVEIKPRGFVAPAWLMEDALLPVLRDSGLGYAVTLSKFFDLRQSRVRRAPVLCTSSRTPLRRALTRQVVSMLAKKHANEPLLRIAVHPVDFEYPQMEEFIYRLIAETLETRQAATYAELLPATM